MPERSYNIVLCIFSLNGGGAEKVLTEIANFWANKNHNVSVITELRCVSFYKLHANINHIVLDTARKSSNKIQGLLNNGYTLLKLTKTIQSLEPDIIISFMTSMNVLCVISSMLLKKPVIISERYNPFKIKPNRFWQMARRWTYPRADFLVVQSDLAKTFFLNFCKQEKLKVIYNPISPDFVNNLTPVKKDKIILNVARLNYVKGQDILIQAFAESDIKDWNLYIIGEGEERENLQKLVAKLNLTGRVFLPGQSKNVSAYYKMASIFVLSSRSEGFPNCLLEAMNFGLTCISTECGGGTEVLITNEKNGLLIPTNNSNALAKELKKLVSNPDFAKSLGESASISVQKFNIEVIMQKWETLVGACIDK